MSENDYPTEESNSLSSPQPENASPEAEVMAESKMHHLSGMYETWFLDYASYVILERAVPHIEDGLKPVQRRVLHAMHTLDNGRLTKVAKIVGATMAFHPHGDASINDALVQLGQKGYLIDTQGNWGNILTGDDAAAGRYIEAKLSAFANEVVFNDKITPWKRSYDGSADEPVALPVKYPLLLAQGAEGIAVGLSSKILPHNFMELADACCAYLRGDNYKLYPDFPTGGLLDVSRYNDGERGGSVKSRAKIVKLDNRTLSITELPAGKTTASLIDSIIKANDKGKIRIKKIDDMTAASADIRIHLPSGVSSDKTLDALYAFTDCEISISPNACVIYQDRPHFLSVSKLLEFSAERTKELLHQELSLRLKDREESYFAASLERIFIEERIYKDKEFEEAKNEEAALKHVEKRLTPWMDKFIRPVEYDDLRRLLEIRMARILRFNIPKHEAMMLQLEGEIAELKKNISRITEYTIHWFEYLKERYGDLFPRKTQLMNFDTIEVTKVAELDEKLYVNREGGFIGTSLKGDEFVCNCSSIDDIIIFFRSGKYIVTKVDEKKFVGNEEILHIGRFLKSDDRTIYNVVYKDGKRGPYYIKRFSVTSITRDKDYDVTQGGTGSKVVYFTANTNGEAETIRIKLKRKPKQRINEFEKDFSEIAIKNRSARGNLLTKGDVNSIVLRAQGTSTLGGREVWFDKDIMRLNYNGQGTLLGEFFAEDKILVILDNGECYLTNFSDTNHFESNLYKIEKYNPLKVWTAIYEDAQHGFTYLKRFTIEDEKKENIGGEDSKNKVILLTDIYYPRFEIVLGGKDAHRKPIEIDADEFIGVKSIRAKGKRITNFIIEKITELEPLKEAPSLEYHHLVQPAESSEESTVDDDDYEPNLFSNLEID